MEFVLLLSGSLARELGDDVIAASVFVVAQGWRSILVLKVSSRSSYAARITVLVLVKVVEWVFGALIVLLLRSLHPLVFKLNWLIKSGCSL